MVLSDGGQGCNGHRKKRGILRLTNEMHNSMEYNRIYCRVTYLWGCSIGAKETTQQFYTDFSLLQILVIVLFYTV